MTSISGSIIWIMWIYYVKPTALLGLSNYRDYTLHCRTCCGLQVCNSIFFSVMWMLLLPAWISLEMIPTINFPLSFQNFRLQTRWVEDTRITAPFSHPWATSSYCTWTGNDMSFQVQCCPIHIVHVCILPYSLVRSALTFMPPSIKQLRTNSCSWCGIFDIFM